MWSKVVIFVVWCLLENAALSHSSHPSNDTNIRKHIPHPYLQTEIDPKIIGGSPIAITSVPWQVSMRLKAYEKNFGSGHICGGSVITSRVVVSAAHCVINSDLSPMAYRSPSEFTIVMGSVYLYEVTQYTLQFDVLEIVHHPEFNLTLLQNDVSLLFLDGLIPKNYPTVAPISLNQMALQADDNCSVTGWGVTESGIVWPELLGVVVPIVSTSICNESYIGEITDGMICAGYMATGGKDACQGDSGGPLACNGTLAGIVSWGNGCAEPGFPGVYTNVSAYHDWILLTNSTFNYTRYNSASSILRLSSEQLVYGIFCLLISWMTS